VQLAFVHHKEKKKMKITLHNAAVSVPLAAASCLAIANSAEAANLAAGSILNINGSVNVPDQNTFEFYDFTGFGGETAENPEPVGQAGEFTVGAGNTGSFEGLEGDTGQILSFDRNTDLGTTPLLRLNDLDGTPQEFFATSFPTTEVGNGTATVQVDGVFRNGNEIETDGIFTSQFAEGESGETTYSASLETVPEPTTMAGSAMALGLGAFLKRKRANKQNKEEETA
jgi:hypothetical protein